MLEEAVSLAAELAESGEHEWYEPHVALSASVGVFGDFDTLDSSNGLGAILDSTDRSRWGERVDDGHVHRAWSSTLPLGEEEVCWVRAVVEGNFRTRGNACCRANTPQL